MIDSLAIPIVHYDAAQRFVLDRMDGPDCGGPTTSPGVYAICASWHLGHNGKRPIYSPELVLYVGSSKSIRNRFKSPDHPLNVLREMLTYPDAVYAKTLECHDYLAKEIQLIRLFRPQMNIQYNG